MPNVQHALGYMREGFSIIPLKGNHYAKGGTPEEKYKDAKKSLILWAQYQKQRPTEDEIKGWFKKWPHANIGIVTGVISGIAVVDIDEPEIAKESLQDLIPDSIVMPVANTPSGGQHYYFKCPDEKLSNNTRTIPGCDLRANGGYVVAVPSTNGNGGEYTWHDGLSIHDVALPELPSAYLSFIKKSFNNINNNSLYRGPVTPVTDMFMKGRRDNDLFHLASSLLKGKMPKDEILQVLHIMANNCNPPFPIKEIETKILSAIKRQDRQEINLTSEIEKWVSVTEGNFSITECYNELQTVTGVSNRNNYRVVLNRLKGKGVIERSGNKDGIFRRVENDTQEIDFLSADDTELEIDLPFNIDSLVDIHPKSIIVIAGAPNAGKTALCLNIAEANMHNYDVCYFSSEMSAQELKSRLSKFDRPITDFKKVTWLERSHDHHDVIKPDSLNIIDFLEVHEDFWKIGLYIKQIFDKLNKGIAVISIQKDRGKEVGLGATRGLEKARLYLSMNPNEMNIVKAKNWASPSINPNGMKLNFKLFLGCKFSITKDWHK